MKPAIRVTIKRDSTVTVEVNGVSGPSCKDLTAALEDKLGSVTRVEEKGDYYEQENSESLNH